LHTAEDARARLDTAQLAEKRWPNRPAICIKSGFPMILMSVVSTKTNAGDPGCWGGEGKIRGFKDR